MATASKASQKIGQLIHHQKQCGNYLEVLSLWSQHFHDYHTAPTLGSCFSVLASCSQVCSSSASSVCEQVFSATQSDNSLNTNVILYTAIMKTFQKCGNNAKVLDVWNHLQQKPLKWDNVTYICVLSACASIGQEAISTGESIHSQLSPYKLRNDDKLFSALLNMRCGQPGTALDLAEKMWNLYNGTFGNKYIFTCILTACTMVGPSALAISKRICQTISSSSTIEFDVKLFGSVVAMYHRCEAFREILDLWWNEKGCKVADENSCMKVLTTCSRVSSTAALAVCEAVHARIRENYPGDGNLYQQLVMSYYNCKAVHHVVVTWGEMVKNVTQLPYEGSYN